MEKRKKIYDLHSFPHDETRNFLITMAYFAEIVS
jgi:hypothetical protein